MPHFICVTCGVQHAASEVPPGSCAVCTDERQYVRWEGQAWTTLDELREEHRNRIEDDGGLTGVGTEPTFAIGQRALLVPSGGGNVLWDCVTLVDGETVSRLEELGGVTAIAVSHPHYYSAVVEWSRAFGGVPVYLHEADREWIMRPDPCVVHWEGERLELDQRVSLIRLGGHFPGGTVLHWPDGAEGRGVLLSGDILQVTMDRRFVSFMYSYPNDLPLDPATVRRIGSRVAELPFERLYGAWWGRNVLEGAEGAVRRSVERYVRGVTEGWGT